MHKLTHGLLFTEETLELTSGADMPCDLKLDALLPEGTTDFLRVKPTVAGLLMRRELFSRILLDRENAKMAFEKMRELLNGAKEAHESLEGAVCDKARDYIFSEFAARLADFYRCAAVERSYGELYSVFSGV